MCRCRRQTRFCFWDANYHSSSCPSIQSKHSLDMLFSLLCTFFHAMTSCCAGRSARIKVSKPPPISPVKPLLKVPQCFTIVVSGPASWVIRSEEYAEVEYSFPLPTVHQCIYSWQSPFTWTIIYKTSQPSLKQSPLEWKAEVSTHTHLDTMQLFNERYLCDSMPPYSSWRYSYDMSMA